MPRGRRPRSKAGVFPPPFRPAYDSPDPIPEPSVRLTETPLCVNQEKAQCEPRPHRRGPKPKPVNHEVRIVAENVTINWS